MEKLIVANWKDAFLTRAKAERLLKEINGLAAQFKDVTFVVCPPLIWLGDLKATRKVLLAGQNCAADNSLPLTGETTVRSLKQVGCSFVLLGHSERRRFLRESDDVINKKILLAQKAKLKTILCVGEREKEGALGSQLIISQTERGLKGFPLALAGQLVLAYEPLFAVSYQSGLPAPWKMIDQKVKILRHTLKEIFGVRAAKVLVLYGGSVSEKNAAEILRETRVDGFLIGRASLQPKVLAQVARSLAGLKV